MTVIATIISQYCTVHASDSYITNKRSDGTWEIIDPSSTKIVSVPRWAGIMSFFGTARAGSDWNIVDFLQGQVNMSDKCSGPEDFADMVSEALDRIPAVRGEGIGIHFTAYERCDGYLIPELFLITNFLDPQYKVGPNGVHYTRETYSKIEPQDDTSPHSEHGKLIYRHKVREFLESGNVYIYNNGDPILFNLSARGIFNMLGEAARRQLLRPLGNCAEYRKLALWPVEQVARLQGAFFRPEKQIVGGVLHTLSVTAAGEYESD